MTTKQQTTIQQIGLGTIEHWSPELSPQEQSKPNYDYWTDYIGTSLPALGIDTPSGYDDLYKAKAIHARAVSSIVEDPTNLSELEAVHNGSRINVFSTAIRQWSDEFGNFNSRVDAKETFIKAASLMLQEQIGAWSGKAYTFTNPILPEELGVGALSKRIGTVPSQGLRYVLLAGELIHKSAWLERDDPEGQFRKFSMALDMYQRVIKASRLHKQEFGPDAVRATQNSVDIKFYLAQKRYRENAKYGSASDAKNALSHMRQLIAKETSYLSDYYAAAWKRGTDGGFGGGLTEKIVPLLIRDAIVNSIELEEADESEFFAVRSAFLHEDVSPPSHKMPKAGFDMVIQRVIEGAGIVTTPVQIKSRKFNSDEKSETYLPGIITVTSNGINVHDMNLTIGALKKKYSGNRHKDVIQSINPVSEFRQRLVEGLLAA